MWSFSLNAVKKKKKKKANIYIFILLGNRKKMKKYNTKKKIWLLEIDLVLINNSNI